MDIFMRIDAVSLGILAEGTYTIVLIGKNHVYYDTLNVPSAAPDTNFSFHITARDISTHQTLADVPIELLIGAETHTRVYDTTDMSGEATIIYPYDMADTLIYHILTGSNLLPGYYGQTLAIKGIPEVITLGIGE